MSLSQESSDKLMQRSMGDSRSSASEIDLDISAPSQSRVRTGGTDPSITGSFIAIGDDPPIFRPAWRDYVAAPREQIDIVNPLPAPVPPSVSIAKILIPLIIGIIVILILSPFTLVIPAIFQNGRHISFGNLDLGNIMTIIVSIITLVSLLYNYFDTIYKYIQGRGTYQGDVERREQSYRSYLAQRRQHLDQLRAEQLQASLAAHPSIKECLMRAAQRHQHLWERAPGDPDFLEVRLGVGRGLPSFTIKSSLIPQQLPESDPLLQAARDLVADYATINDLPVTLSLPHQGTVGIAGPPGILYDATRSMLIQLATHHAPSDLKIVLIFSHTDWHQWIWARWLPHVWSDDRSRRYMAASPDAAYQLLSEMSDLIKHRQRTSDPSSGARAMPALVFVLAGDNEEIARFPGMSRLVGSLSRSHIPDVYTIFVADRPEELPRSCRGVVELSAGVGSLRSAGSVSLEQEFVPDITDIGGAQEFAWSLAPLRLQSQTDGSGLPSVVTLFDLLGIQRVEDLPVADLWRQSTASESLVAPIGLRGDGERLRLDLHERNHGPHTLIAGMSGTGKSVLLQSLVASLAVHYHPHDIAFFLIDYKGDGVATQFHDLPHQVGIITTTAGGMTTRTLETLQQIFQRRQFLFSQAGVNDIDAYIRSYRQQKTAIPLPHLIVVIDEFGELAQTYPDFMSEMIKMVQANRALGVHLLLSTARPAEVIDERIWNSVRLRLCLGTEHAEDSQRVIGNGDAAELRHPGRGYVRVNRADIFDLFQTAWAGAPYYPDGINGQLVEINEVDLSGRRSRIGPPPSEAGQSQLRVLIERLKQIAQQKKVQRLIGPWLALPSEIVTIETLRRGGTEGWDGNGWQPSSGWLMPMLGLVDDPVRRFQGPLQVSLNEGPTALLGSPQAGKTTLLKSIITSLVLSHTPSQVHLYILDFGEYLARIFRGMPHIVCATLPDENEELGILVYTLLVEIDRRKDILASVGAIDMAAYRKQMGESIPDIVLIFDHYSQFVTLYPTLMSSVERVINEGSQVGIHLIVTAHDEKELPTWLRNKIVQTVLLEVRTPQEIHENAGESPNKLLSRTLLLRKAASDAVPLSFQKALPAAGISDNDRDEVIRGIAKAMAFAWHGSTARESLHEPDLYDNYELGLRQLLNRLPQADSAYSNALVYQQRLHENITQSRLFGDTDDREADRAEIIHQLNELTRSVVGTSFKALCGMLTTDLL
jgi:DNA segregation ATPase FtsK/SpoIIIE, S-DNA-T family